MTLDTEYDGFDENMKLWKKNKAVAGGSETAKNHDFNLSVHPTVRGTKKNGRPASISFDSILVPHNPNMNYDKWQWYIRQSSLPNFVSNHIKVMIGSMTKSLPTFKIDSAGITEEMAEEIRNWLLNDVTSEGKSILHFLSQLLYEEILTGNTYVRTDYNDGNDKYFPVVVPSENIIRFSYTEAGLEYIIIKGQVELQGEEPFTKVTEDVLYAHYLTFRDFAVDGIDGVGTAADPIYTVVTYMKNKKGEWIPIEARQPTNVAGMYFNTLPIYQSRGNTEIALPPAQPIVDKEIELYNHTAKNTNLLYNKSQATIVYKHGTQAQQGEVEKDPLSGVELGSVISIDGDAEVSLLDIPGEALEHYSENIKQLKEDLRGLGMRSLEQMTRQPESGFSLSVKNTESQLTVSSLSRSISASMKRVIVDLVFWRYNVVVEQADIDFNLSTDISKKADNVDNEFIYKMFLDGNLTLPSLLLHLQENGGLSMETKDEDLMGEPQNTQENTPPAPEAE